MHEECLTFTLTSFSTTGWISERQLLSMIKSLDDKDQALAFIVSLKLLHLNHQQFFAPSPFEANLAKILRATAPLAQFRSPLQFLAGGDLPEFQALCEKSQDGELRRMGRASIGLFPPSSEQKDKCLYLLPDNKIVGNPCWVWARKALRDYYMLKRTKMGDEVKEIFEFLLSSEELLHSRGKAFRYCWSCLYLFFNNQVLAQHLEEFIDRRAAVTWSTFSLEETFQQLQRSLELLSAQERIPYYLALNLLNAKQNIAPFVSCSPLEAAFHLFLQTSSQVRPDLQLMLLLLFLVCAERSSLPSVAAECRNQYRKLLERRLPKVQLYLSFFLPLREIAQNLILFGLSPAQVPMKPEERQRLYDILLDTGEEIIQLSGAAISNHFFTGLQLSDPLKGEQIIIQAERTTHLWLQRLAIELPSAKRADIEQSFLLFLDTWSKYYSFLKAGGIPDLYAAIETGECLKQLLPLPRTSPEAIFNILMGSVRVFKESQHKEVMAEFESEVLPELLSLLPSNRAQIFQQEWGSLPRQNSQMPLPQA